MLDLEYVQLNVTKVLALFNKVRPTHVYRDEADRSCSQSGDRLRKHSYKLGGMVDDLG